MAFRYSGTNWAGIDWYTAKPITKLGSQIEALRPGTFPVDGTVASQTHDQNSPTSDHKPQNGVVRAIDFGSNYDQLMAWAESIRRSEDPRLKYMIFDSRIVSSYWKSGIPPYTWRPYSGSNPHSTHVHLSSLTAYDNDLTPWQLEEPDMADTHKHRIPPENLPRAWADTFWDLYVEDGGTTVAESRNWEVYREDLAWFDAKRVQEPIQDLEARIDGKLADLDEKVSQLGAVDLDEMRTAISNAEDSIAALQEFDQQVRDL